MKAATLMLALLDGPARYAYCPRRGSLTGQALAGSEKLLAALRTFHLLKIHPLDQIRCDHESAVWASLVERRLHRLQIDLS